MSPLLQKISTLSAGLGVGVFLLLTASASSMGEDCHLSTEIKAGSPAEARAYFDAQKKTVLTFVGYSGAGYEHPAQMLEEAGRILDGFDPAQTLVNIGATADGIGAVYSLAKKRGFRTTGIVSTQARDQKARLSPCVDVVFYIADSTWGGFLSGSEKLSPTSEAMVTCSSLMVAIGGGEVARDELTAARRAGKPVRVIPADMNHELAIARAAKTGLPPPKDFSGAVSAVQELKPSPKP